MNRVLWLPRLSKMGNTRAWGVSTRYAVAGLLAFACIPKDAATAGANAPATAGGPTAVTSGAAQAEAPPPPPRAPVPAVAHTGDKQTDRFLELWTDMHDLGNGYFSPEGIPYHSVETL